MRGKSGRSIPFCIFQSTGFRLVASSFSKTSSCLGVGIGTSTCCNRHKTLTRHDIKSLAIIFEVYQAGKCWIFCSHFAVKCQPLSLRPFFGILILKSKSPLISFHSINSSFLVHPGPHTNYLDAFNH